MTEKATDGLSARAYLRVLARWKWVIIAVTVVVTILGGAYTWTRTPLYAASAQLLYVKQIDIANPLSQSFIDTTAQQAEIESVPTVIQSAKVNSAAQRNMGPAHVNAGYSVSAVLQPGLNNMYSNVVAITGVSPSPAAAADAANAYAQAFIDWGKETAQAQVADAITVVKGQLASFTTSQSLQTSEYTSLQQSLQQLELLQASAGGNFNIITQASPPSIPFSPQKKRGIAVAFVGGLVLGIGLAFLLEQFDTRVRGDEQVSDLLELPIIGHVPQVGGKGREKSILHALSDLSGPAAEAYRVLRSNLDFVSIDGEIKTLLVSSSVQGEGKSVTACNLAVSMALAGKNVILVDADLRSPRVHAYMGVPNALGVSSVIARRTDADEALVPVKLDVGPRKNGALVMTPTVAGVAGARAGGAQPAGAGAGAPLPAAGYVWLDGAGDTPSLRVLPSGPLPPNPGEMVASRRFGEIIEHLATQADIVLVDAPAMLPVGDTVAVAPWVDAMVYVVNPQRVRRPDLQQARAQLAHLPCHLLGIIEVAERKSHGYYAGYYSHSADGGRAPLRRRG